MNTDEKLREYLKKVTLELRRTQARLQEVEHSADPVPIAIVGLSCRGPGQVESPEAYWELLVSGRDAISEFPDDRGWDLDRLYDPDPAASGKSYVQSGGFLRGAGDFDAAFFGISPREALATDPQQRLLLETAWEALEEAGIAPPSLQGSSCGVFIGLAQNNYQLLGATPELEGYVVTGSTASVASGRIAYTLGLHGPALTVDTACSAALVAVHVACQSLQLGECALALAGSAALLPTPDAFIEFSRQRALAPDGRCKPFSKHADGTAWGEAAGMLVLERLPDAERLQHPIRALIRGSAVNQDGKSQGLTAPNGLAQQQVIASALEHARVSPAEIDAVEAHGTGTTLGDPIEAEALIATYGRAHDAEHPLWLGSVKANIGHTQAAAGVMGIIKLVLALEHELLPPTLRAEEPTPHVDWSAGSVRLLREPVQWRRNARPRRAAVSSFGISGTNAHLILEEPPPSAAGEQAPTALDPMRPLPFVLSGRVAAALRGQAARLHAHLLQHPELTLADVAHSLVTTRAELESRAVLVAGDRPRLLLALQAVANGDADASAALGHAAVSGKVVFVFPGQGGQWLGMARDLFASSEPFALQMRACADALSEFVDWSLLELLGDADERWLERVDVVQPVLFAMMVSLASLWRAHGVEPDAVVGHSQGEIAAAYVAGALSLRDAARVVALRSRALLELSGRGAMAAVELSAEALAPWLERHRGVSIAAINSPAACVVSGDSSSIDTLLAALSSEQILARRVRVDFASHSVHVEAIERELQDVLAGLAPSACRIPFVSTVRSEVLDGAVLDGAYWYQNLRAPVQFADAIARLLDDGFREFIEVSPHPVLTASVQACAAARKQACVCVGTLRRDHGSYARFLMAFGELYAHGGRVDWQYAIPRARRVPLPTYAFVRERHWLDGSSTAARGVSPSATIHPLLESSVLLADGQGAVFTGRLSLHRHRWLAEHVVHGSRILPATAFVEMAWAVAQRLGSFALDELVLEAPLVLPERGAIEIQVWVGAAEHGHTRALSVHARLEDAPDDAAWIRHASGTLRPEPIESRPTVEESLRDWPPPGALPLAIDELYPRLAASGMEYGPSFRGVCRVFRVGAALWAEVRLPEVEREQAVRYGLHPALFDAALHMLGLERAPGAVNMPFVFRGARLHAACASALRVRARPGADGEVALICLDERGELVASVEGLQLRAATSRQLRAAPSVAEAAYRVTWPAIELDSGAAVAAANWVLLGETTRGLPQASARYAGMSALCESIASGSQPTAAIVAPWLPLTAAEATALGHETSIAEQTGALALAQTASALAAIQAWLADERLNALPLWIVTRGAVAAVDHDRVPDLVHAPLWGLVRAVQAEHPDAPLHVLDLDSALEPPAASLWQAALCAREPQLALRDGRLCAPRLTRTGAALLPPSAAESDWSLQIGTKGTLEGLELQANPPAALGDDEVRIAVAAAGLNFRDVLGTLGMYPGDLEAIGSEGAGVVVEVGAAVTDLRPGARVMGLWPRAFGVRAVASRNALVPMPDALSFVDAAGAPAVFLTAYYGLFDLGELQAGQRVLVHAAAGGVGMAALQLAQRAGAEVFATASPTKWHALRRLGLDDDHIASSRTLEFEAKFGSRLGARGIDLVLNSLAREFTDASLRLLRPAGRFIDMSKTDIREPAEIASSYRGVHYRAFALGEAAPARIQAMLVDIARGLQVGSLSPLPVRVWDVRKAPAAFRYMAQARHVGKIVLTMPRPLSRGGTVLITGGTGVLGALIAQHLVEQHAATHLLLCSRTGHAPAELVAQLEARGASVRVASCDVSQRAQVEALLAQIDPAHPLCAVIHAAGVLDDGLVTAQNGARLERVFAPKVLGALHLHELTRGLDLQAFVLFSSLAGVLGAAGQSNYAAASAFLDALAQQRRAEGLPAVSLDWGYWAQRSGLTAGLGQADLERMARAGVKPLASIEALQLYDASWEGPDAQVVPVRLAPQLLAAAPEQLPALLRGLARRSLRRAASNAHPGSELQARLGALPANERERVLHDLLASAVNAVMGIPKAQLAPERPLRDLGLDSLLAVELRNRLATATGLRLPATLLFDHPTPSALVLYLEQRLLGAGVPQRVQPRAVVDASEPIAIVGIGCRYPGGASTPEALWQLLLEGVDAVSDFPADRGWDADALYDPDPDATGKVVATQGGFLRDALEFDAGFFEISPREALGMDPQQRLLLETTWEALERAGLDPRSLHDSATGVFIGTWQCGYESLALPAELEGYRAAGMAPSIASGRIAYSLGLQGPALTVDTACSSSLVALHLACQSLRQGECDLAVAGGVTVMATPGVFVSFSRQRVMAPDGRCKAFSDAADGAGWSEGVGVLTLERARDAQRHGRAVLALVRGSAINQDGKSQGLTAPNGPAQERVIQQALAIAQLTAADVDVVEGHGTGTALGDPIEIQALLATYGAQRPAEQPLWLGSLKSNLGHTQAAAGVAGVIKLVLALQHELLPRSLYAERATQQVDWSLGSVKLLDQPVTWQRNGRPRRGAVSSFGISGTNAHLIIEEPPPSAAEERPVSSASSAATPEWLPFVIGATTDAALRDQARRLREHLLVQPEVSLLDLAYSLVATRTAFELRAVIVAQTRQQLLDSLERVATGKPDRSVVFGRARNAALALLFAGQGSQRPRAGEQLYEAQPAFRAALDAACSAFDAWLDRPLLTLLFALPDSAEAALLDATEYTQPALFALEVALYRALEAWGVRPQFLLGHSLGEIAAAHVAGVMSLNDACKLVAARARAMQALPNDGAMLALDASESELEALIAPRAAALSLAAVNGPRALVVSGDAAAVVELQQAWQAQGRKAQRLNVSHAFHSAHMQPMLGPFAAIVSALELRPAQLRIASNVSGQLEPPQRFADPDYWVQQVRRPVRFSDGVRALCDAGAAAFLELAPAAGLCAVARDAMPETQADLPAWSVLRKGRDEGQSWMLALAGLYANGQPVDFAAQLAASGGRTIGLPTYAFQRQRYWPTATGAGAQEWSVRAAGLSDANHPLLGAELRVAGGGETLFCGQLSLRKHPWLAGHVVSGNVLLPGTAFVELALAIARSAGLDYLEELTIEAALPVPERAGAGVDIQLRLGAADSAGRRALTMYQRAPADDGDLDAGWSRCASAMLAHAPRALELDPELTVWPPTAARELDLAPLYDAMQRAGVAYGDAFRGVCAAYRRDAEFFAEVQLPECARADGYGLHPALLDALLHVLALERQDEPLQVPFAWQGVSLTAANASMLRARLSTGAGGTVTLSLADAAGLPIGRVEQLRLRPLASGTRPAADRDALYRVEFQACAPTEGAPPVWALLGRADALPEARQHFADLTALREALDAGEAVADVVVVAFLARVAPDALVAEAHAACHALLALLQRWIEDERLVRRRLVVVTRAAVGAQPSDSVAGLAHAPLWGLVRCVQSEQPQASIALLDLDDADVCAADSFDAALRSDQTQLALRAGALLAPRLVRAASPENAASGPNFTNGTLLITGAAGALGRVVARHLVERHGARHLLLCSRRAPDAALIQQLTAAGARVTAVACDVSQREQLAALLDSIAPEQPLCAVFHAAGILDDAVLEAQTPARFDAVLAPKLDAAFHLHELTRELPLQAFVLFSSVAGLLGGPGQANYAAANAFLDALAQRRKACGSPAIALDWGYWAAPGGMSARLQPRDRARLARAGLGALSGEHALGLLDAALVTSHGQLVPARLDMRALSAQPRLPAMLSALVARRTARAAAASGATSLPSQLAKLSPVERERVLRLVTVNAVSSVLGVAPASVELERPLSELGLDSLTAVELRNQLAERSGLRLSPTLLFDHPSAAALSRFLLEQLAGESSPLEAAAQARPQATDPIAIIGMSCRYPGGASSPEALWRLLEAGADATSDFPTQRGWDAAALYDPDPDAAGKTTVTRGGFLHEAAEFEPGFFGIAPREALAMDPQQRLLLETSWEALESAGIEPRSRHGTLTGVFVGIMYSDYAARFTPGSAGSLEGLMGVGSAPSVASGRIAYHFGLEGPAITLDTACSSSLVTIHLACNALRQGECDLALAGGATVMATPGAFIEFSRQRGLALDGRCKSFSAAADGVAWSEGVGVVALERLGDAQRAGRPVLGLVRGSAVNQDGKSQGLTAPNGKAQVQVIRQALASAALEPADIDVVEAHGTGTTLGDPIEAQALLSTYGVRRASDRALWLGSLKSNLGHTQAAAGVAGVIKIVLAMQHGLLPRTLHASEPSAHVDWAQGGIELLQESVPWPRGERARRAGVSSFGISGTNAHVILEEPPAPLQPSAAVASRVALESLPFVVSARSDEALCEQARSLHDHLRAHPELPLLDVAHTLATARSAFESRAVVLARDRDGVLQGLQALVAAQPHTAVVVGRSAPSELALLFSGQGSQRVQQGKQLYEALPVFREALDRVFAAFGGAFDPPLPEVMFAQAGTANAGLLDRTEYTQPALFALEVALYRMLESFGVRASYLLGHSVGEIAAAHVAGVMSLVDACRMVVARAQLMQALPPGGAMLALEASEEEVLARLGADANVALAAVNAAHAVVISGDEPDVAALGRVFEGQGRKVRRLSVSHAFHSARMEPMLARFAEVVRGLQLEPARIAIVSNVSGELAAPECFTDPEYWVEHVRATVRFHPGVRALAAAGVTAYLELGPQAVLSTLAEEALLSHATDEPAVWSLLRREIDEPQAVLRALTGLHVRAGAVDFARVFEQLPGRLVSLPTYAFTRSRYWLDSAPVAGDAARLGAAACDHPLLGAEVPLAGEGGALFIGRLSSTAETWLSEHSVFDGARVPVATWVELALSAAQRTGLDIVETLTLAQPALLPKSGGLQLQLSVGASDERGRRTFSVHTRPDALGADAAWSLNASGSLAPAEPDAPSIDDDDAPLRIWPPLGAANVELGDFDRTLADAGVTYGETLRGLRAVYRRGEELFASVQLPERVQADAGRYALHPALLESLWQLLALRQEATAELEQPAALHRLHVRATGAAELRVRVSPAADSGRLRCLLADAAGQTLGEISALHMRRLEAVHAATPSVADDGLYRVEWAQAPAAQPFAGTWAIVGDDAGVLGQAPPRFADLAQLMAASADTPAPALVVLPCLAGEDSATAACRQTERVLVQLQAWLADPRLADSQLLVLTRGAVAADGGDDIRDLGHAGLWGLVRAAQSEHPDAGLRLLDVDDSSNSHAALLAAFGSSESQLALRAGELKCPRLANAGAGAGAIPFDPEGTVLITGGSGTLAGILARHLVRHYGARQLLLCSRSGRADELCAELRAQGAHVTIAACDVSDREAVRGLLQSIPESRPLTAVFHTAGVTDDAVLTSQDGARLARVFQGKVDGAAHLDELTRDASLRAFVLFSSLSGVIGGAGQANYAAANTVLDAIAVRRRARGLPATSLAFGYWAERSVLSAHVSSADRARIARAGIEPLSAEQGLALIDFALSRDEPAFVPARFRASALRELEYVPPPLRSLVRGRRRRVDAAALLKSRLAQLSESERSTHVLHVVRLSIAEITNVVHTNVKPNQPVQELGLDSLMALELRKHLARQTGLRLPASLLFDYPTPSKLARHLSSKLTPELPSAGAAVLSELDRLEAALAQLNGGGDERTAVEARLRAFARKWLATHEAAAMPAAQARDLYRANDDELYELIDKSLSQ